MFGNKNIYRTLIALMMFAVVASAEDDPVTKYVASLPWHESRVTSPKSGDKPDFIITISFKREGVISDTNNVPLKLYPVSDSACGLTRDFECRDSWGQKVQWSRGTVNVIEAEQNGFKIELELTWGGVNIPTETFKESFGCVWKTQQEFTTNGFHIIVETATYNAEQTNAPYSSPSAGSKR